MPVVTGTHLTKRFHQGGLLFNRQPPVQAITDVTLAVEEREVVGLVGESGSGKSTLGRMLLGLIPPTSGTVRFAGADLAAIKGAAMRRLRRQMQIIFQDPFLSLDPKRVVGEQIADGPRIHGLVSGPAVAQRVAGLLADVGLEPASALRHPDAFSGGQRQRIAIARALSTDPRLLVADEPVSSLDVSVQAQIVNLLSDLRTRKGLAIIFISHDLAVVRFLCDRVLVLYLGRVMEEGPTEAVLHSPVHPYTQALLAAEPGRKHAGGAGPRLLVPGEPPSPVNPPSGCVFRTRCPHAARQCALALPPRKACGAGHFASCVKLEGR
jgi:peptide/nickel transport system ATP-binding protein